MDTENAHEQAPPGEAPRSGQHHERGGPPPLGLLRRSRDDRVVAGVAGGLGRWARVDPVLFRVGFAVLTVFGGAGLFLYAIGWLLVPQDGEPMSEGQRLASGAGRGRALEITLATVAGIALVAIVLNGNVTSVSALLVVGALVAVVATRRDRPGDAAAAREGGTTPPPPTQPAHDPPPAATPPHTPTATAYGPPPAYGPAATPGTAGGYGPPPGQAPTAPYAPPPPPPAPRERSVLTPVTLSAAAIVVGVLLALDLADVLDVPARVLVSSALAVMGVGLLIGAYTGRGRGLIAAGAVLTVVLAFTVVTPEVPLGGGVGDRTWVPVAAADTDDPYELAAGNAELDLTRLDTTGQTVDVDAQVGLGNLVVLVPDDVDLRIRADVSGGEIDLPDDVKTDGLDVHRTLFDPAGVSPGDGMVDLTTRVGLGNVEVRRVAS